MRIPTEAVVDPRKLSDYLLKLREDNDKSQFLAQAGFEQVNVQTLEASIRASAEETEAFTDRSNEYGDFLRQHVNLKGPNGRKLPVVLIWIRRKVDGRIHFVTLKPRKESFR